MAKLIVPQEGEQGLGATQAEAVQVALHAQRKRDTVQSLISSGLVIGLLLVILGLIAIASWSTESPTIVTYHAPVPKEELIETPEMKHKGRPNPPGRKSSRAKVISAVSSSPVTVPVPENPVPTGPFGMSDEIGDGWGDAEGDGDGGGGASFFGSYRKGRRVAYVVDFSRSMLSDAEGGGLYIDHLKKELNKSIAGLTKGMSFTVIFFSSRVWTLSTEPEDGRDYLANGWNGVGEPPLSAWYPATEEKKKWAISKIKAMPADGGTMWYPPISMALKMSPGPSIVYLLSDGEPRDGDFVLDGLKEMNPAGTAIDTIAFELPGSPAALLLQIAEKTGGKFSMVYKGELKKGRAAEKFTDPEYD